MTRRMPLVHFHRRPRTHVLERARPPLKSGRKKAVEIPIPRRARLRDGHLADCRIRIIYIARTNSFLMTYTSDLATILDGLDFFNFSVTPIPS